MSRWIPFLGALAVGFLMAGVAGASVELSRYRVILDRKPFGSETPPASAATPGSGGGGSGPVVEPFIKFLKISAFVRDDFSPLIRVGLVETRSNQSYLLAEGESADGLTLVRADFEGERVLISKEREAYWLTMDGTYTLEREEALRPVAVEPEAEPAPEEVGEAEPGQNETVPPSAPVVDLPRAAPAEPTPGPEMGAVRSPSAPPRRTLTERRRMIEDIRRRRAELARSRMAPAEEEDDSAPPSVRPATPSIPTPIAEPKPGDVQPQPDAADMERLLQEYQLQAIREGREPLPIPLDPEIDAQLVNEGFLPPVEEGE